MRQRVFYENSIEYNALAILKIIYSIIIQLTWNLGKPTSTTSKAIMRKHLI